MARGGPRGSFMDSLHGVRAGSSCSEVRLPAILLNTKKQKQTKKNNAEEIPGRCRLAPELYNTLSKPE